MNDEYERIRGRAIEWVRRAGLMARDKLGSAVSERKEDRSPVTDVDHAVQAELLDAIAREFPDHAVITEETLVDPDRHLRVESARRCWVIDPIDGTRNYARGMPVFSVSLGLLEADSNGAFSPVVGVVFNPMTNQMYSASAGGGAWLDGRPIKVAQPDNPLATDIFIGLPSGREEVLPAVVHGWIDRMVMRCTGSTALNLAMLAGGTLDAVFAIKCRLWDISAGVLLVQEAGGEFVSHEGQPYFPMQLAGYTDELTPFLAAGPVLLQKLVREYQDA